MSWRARTIFRSARRAGFSSCKSWSEPSFYFRPCPEGETNGNTCEICACCAPRNLRGPGRFERGPRRTRASEELDTDGDEDLRAETLRRDYGNTPGIDQCHFPWCPARADGHLHDVCGVLSGSHR